MQKLTIILVFFIIACSDDTDRSTIDSSDCVSDQVLDQSRGACNINLTFTPEFTEQQIGNNRVIFSNNIPNHSVGLFGGGPGSLNPHSISEQNNTYNITFSPSLTGSLRPLLGSNGPRFSFGIMLNGIELDPVAAEPFPHQGPLNTNANWDWNLEAMNTRLGLDCNNGHVQPSGKYHYHGPPVFYLNSIQLPNDAMTLVGYAADGFPIYYKYAFSDPNDLSSPIIEMSSSYNLKSGSRPGDGITAPCGVYDGVYVNDYEYIIEGGTLDEANGRSGVTPEYPGGTYYYVITDEFPGIPRYFKGTPSNDFRIGGGGS